MFQCFFNSNIEMTHVFPHFQTRQIFNIQAADSADMHPILYIYILYHYISNKNFMFYRFFPTSYSVTIPATPNPSGISICGRPSRDDRRVDAAARWTEEIGGAFPQDFSERERMERIPFRKREKTVGNLRNIYGNIWEIYGKYMEIYGNIWKHMEIYENIWKHMEIYGNIWKYMKIYGNIWKYMEIYGNIWKHMEIYGNMSMRWQFVDVCSSSQQEMEK